MRNCLVVLSGGQDSTTCLYWALQEFTQVSTVTFDYGQRHRVEVACAESIAKVAQVPWELVEVPLLRGCSPLVSDSPVRQYGSVDELPGGVEPTFVPFRNDLFLTLAANVAVANEIYDLVTGVCQADYGGYPDCRQRFIDAKVLSLSLAIDRDLRVHTPLMNLTKAETVRLAQELGALPVLALTHTCYQGVCPPCGKCHACLIRARGFAEAGVNDPLLSG